jgi:predicted component of type VI protein secretion system
MLKFQEATFFERCANCALLVLFLLVVIGGLSGCGKSSTVKTEQILFNIATDSRINDERPVYIVIRKVNRTTFQIDDYDCISDMVYASPQNESLLAWQMLMPGKKEKIRITKPDKSDIGVYVLFINPGENWKLMLEAPLKSEYQLKVKNNELEEFTKGFLW